MNEYQAKTKWKVSIVIPCTDRTIGLLRCLKAALDQSYKNIEVLLVENNSIDKKIIPKLVGEIDDERIKHFYLASCKNANVARNYGAKKSSGVYVAFLDSDDFWLSNHISNNVSFFDTNTDAVAVYSGHILNNGIRDEIVLSRPIIDENPYSFLFGEASGIAQTSSYVLKRHIVDEIKWDEKLSRNQDYDFFISIQETYQWHYNPLITSIVVWEYGVIRKFTAAAFKGFYGKHKDKMLEVDRAGYVSGIQRALCQNSKEEYGQFFNEGLLLRKNMKFPSNLYSYGYVPAKIILSLKNFASKIVKRAH